MQYIWSDAWVLLAIIYTGKNKPARLSDMIGAADFINHAIPTFEEMEGALARLTSGGYLIETNGKLSPSEKTKAFYGTVTKPRRRVLTELADIEKLLNVIPNMPSDPRSANRGISYPGLTRKMFEDAVGEYTTKANEIVDKLLRPKKNKKL